MPLRWQTLRALNGQSEACKNSIVVLRKTAGAGSSARKLQIEMQIELWMETRTRGRELPMLVG